MPDYKYTFPVDYNTQKRLSESDETGWIEIFKRVLDDKSIDYNIDFKEFEPKSRLCTLYAVLITLKIDTANYQKALVNLTYEIYPTPENNYQSFILIQVIDYVRPSAYFPRLSLLLTNPAYKYMMAIKAPNGLLLHLYLVNTIMHFDVDFIIYGYLKTLSKSTTKYPSEYHQVFLRYIYSYCEEFEFTSYMNGVFPLFKNEKIYHIVTLTLREYVAVKHSFRLIYQWLNENHLQLKVKNADVFNKFIDYFEVLLKNDKSRLSINELFEEFEKLILRLKSERVTETPLTVVRAVRGLINKQKVVLKATVLIPGTEQGIEPSLSAGQESAIEQSDEDVKRNQESNFIIYALEIEAAKKLTRDDFLISESGPEKS
jgi:hypothetical protein